MYDENNSESKPLPELAIVVHIFWITAVIIAIAAKLLEGSSDKYAYIQTFVLTMTLLVVAWNANLTRKMQASMVQQINVNVLPTFELIVNIKGEYIPNSDVRGGMFAESYLELKNIGQGVALNIEIDPLIVNHGATYGELNLEGEPLWFEKITSLQTNQQKIVKDIQRYDRQRVRVVDSSRRDLLPFLVKPKAVGDYELAIRFTDILGNQYVQIIYLSINGLWSGTVQPSKAVRKLTITVEKESYRPL